MATSVHDSHPPQATGTAASSAAKGMNTNAQRAIMVPVECRPSVSGLGPDSGRSSVVAVMAPHNAGAVVVFLRLRHRNLRNRNVTGCAWMHTRLSRIAPDPGAALRSVGADPHRLVRVAAYAIVLHRNLFGRGVIGNTSPFGGDVLGSSPSGRAAVVDRPHRVGRCAP